MDVPAELQQLQLLVSERLRNRIEAVAVDVGGAGFHLPVKKAPQPSGESQGAVGRSHGGRE